MLINVSAYSYVSVPRLSQLVSVQVNAYLIGTLTIIVKYKSPLSGAMFTWTLLFVPLYPCVTWMLTRVWLYMWKNFEKQIQHLDT